MKTTNILTIAGNDILSGGGFQADLATFAAHRLYGFLAQTCMTAVTEQGFEIIPTPLDVFQKQLDSLQDIPFAAIKIGLLPTPEMMAAVLAFLKARAQIPVVLDPVLVFKENADEEIAQMSQQMLSLFQVADVITPNLKEAQLLSGKPVTNLAEMEEAAAVLQLLGARNVLIKGGARLGEEEAFDLLRKEDGTLTYLKSPLLHRNNQGAGCTFASAVASQLALGKKVSEAAQAAKSFVYQAIAHSNQYGVVQYETD